MAEKEEYVVYRTPIGTILLDYNNTLWTLGYPYFAKSCCTEIERGTCEGGIGLSKFYAELKKKYDADITSEEEVERTRRWEYERMPAKNEPSTAEKQLDAVKNVVYGEWLLKDEYDPIKLLNEIRNILESE